MDSTTRYGEKNNMGRIWILVLFFFLIFVRPVDAYFFDLFQNWPTTEPEAIDFLNIPNSEDIGITLIKGDTWWYKTTTNTVWISGKINQDRNSTVYPLPMDNIDSFSSYYLGDTQRQMESNDGRYWVRDNIIGAPWSYSGLLSEGEINTGSCARSIPTTIDTLSVFSQNGKNAITITQGGWYWYKEDLMVKNYSYCGQLVEDGTGPTTFSGETDFYWQGQLVQLATEGGRWWYWPKPGDRKNYYSGLVNGDGIDKIAVNQNGGENYVPVNPNIFGVNLVWHNPHTAPDIDQIEAKMRELGVKSLRFPGGCGGDSFNWESKTGIPGSGATGTGITIDDYVHIIKKTGVEPLYTFNLEGTTGTDGNTHMNVNCHNLMDYPGTLDQAVEVVSYLKNQGVALNYVEVGNEPWAAESGIPNWKETWTASEYITQFNELKRRLSTVSPTLKMIAAVHGNYRYGDWTQPIATALGNGAYYQAHIYRWGNNDRDQWSTQWQFTRSELENRKQQLIGLGVQNPLFSMSEYNLYCWQGVDGNGYTAPASYPIDPYAQKTGGGFYLADLFREMMLAQINSAMVWHLIDQAESSWRCGILREDSNGAYAMTPAAEVFKLYANNTLSDFHTSVIQDSGIDVITTTNSAGYANTFLVNKTNSTITASLSIPTKTDQGIELVSLQDDSINYEGTEFTIHSSSLPQYPTTLSLSPRSINLIKTVPIETFLPPSIPGDFDGDEQVRIQDFLAFFGRYSQTMSGTDYSTWRNNYLD
jgi:hypothetical protein